LLESITETSQEHDRDVMTGRGGDRYSRRAMRELQHNGAFVIQFRADTNFREGRVSGRVEHIASGHCGQFESVRALLDLLARVLEETQSSKQAPAWSRR
jgi:hypothetical protein